MTLKNIFRKKAVSKLKSTSKLQRLLFSHKISQKIDFILKKEKPKSILFYLPLSFESNILKLLQKKRRENINVFVPFINGLTFKMVKFRLPLQKSKFGTFESGNSIQNIKKVDIIIAPVIGVDGSFRRVGFGKGMYDRFYESLKNRPKLIFVQNIKCFSKNIVTEKHDIKADYYITPKISLKIKETRN